MVSDGVAVPGEQAHQRVRVNGRAGRLLEGGQEQHEVPPGLAQENPGLLAVGLGQALEPAREALAPGEDGITVLGDGGGGGGGGEGARRGSREGGGQISGHLWILLAFGQRWLAVIPTPLSHLEIWHRKESDCM